MKYIFPDFETFSFLDIKHVSTDMYARHKSTRALMCAFAFDSGPLELWQEGETGLDALKRDLQSHIVVPWHAAFEKNISKYVWNLDGLKWRDAMIAALFAGFPAGLKDCVKLPYFNGEAQSTKESLLIRKFCKPKQTAASATERQTRKIGSFSVTTVNGTCKVPAWCGNG